MHRFLAWPAVWIGVMAWGLAASAPGQDFGNDSDDNNGYRYDYYDDAVEIQEQDFDWTDAYRDELYDPSGWFEGNDFEDPIESDDDGYLESDWYYNYEDQYDELYDQYAEGLVTRVDQGDYEEVFEDFYQDYYADYYEDYFGDRFDNARTAPRDRFRNDRRDVGEWGREKINEWFEQEYRGDIDGYDEDDIGFGADEDETGFEKGDFERPGFEDRRRPRARSGGRRVGGARDDFGYGDQGRYYQYYDEYYENEGGFGEDELGFEDNDVDRPYDDLGYDRGDIWLEEPLGVGDEDVNYPGGRIRYGHEDVQREK